MAEPLHVGSMDRIEGVALDLQDGIPTPVDLTGATLSLKLSINGGAVKDLAAQADPDQVVNIGKWSYQLAAGDIDAAGTAEFQLHVTIGPNTWKSSIEQRDARRSLA